MAAGSPDSFTVLTFYNVLLYIEGPASKKKTDKLRKFELRMDWSETRSMEMGC